MGSSQAIPDLENNLSDIGCASEQQTLTDKQQKYIREDVVALDGMTIIVNTGHQVLPRTLTINQLKEIYTAKEPLSWSHFGGDNVPVIPFAREDASGTEGSFEKLVLDGAGVSKRAVPDKYRCSSQQEMLERVSDPMAVGAIGFIGMDESKKKKLPNNILVVRVGATAKQAVAPDFGPVKTETYLLTRRLFVYTRKDSMNPLVKDFLGYILSAPKAMNRDVIEATGFVNLELDQLNRTLQPPIANPTDDYSRLTHDAIQLSFAFRFQPGTPNIDSQRTLPDSRAMEDIKRLARWLEAMQSRIDQVLLLGFANSDSPQPSKSLSDQRAENLKKLLKHQAPRLSCSILTKGFGSTCRIVENDSAESDKQKNRRVEVWVKWRVPTP